MSKEKSLYKSNKTFVAVFIGVFVFLFLLAAIGTVLSVVGTGESVQGAIDNEQSRTDNRINDFAETFANNDLIRLKIADSAVEVQATAEVGALPFKRPIYRVQQCSAAALSNSAATAAVQKSKSGVVIEASSKRVLIDENMKARCYPASTTKVLTALIALRKLNLDTLVTVPKEAEAAEGSSIYLRAGEKITVRDLLYGLMLRSGNDAAVTLAYAVSGSVEEFAALMNKTARECGATDSNFVNPHGLHDDNHVTTAYDLAMITACAYENKDFCDIASTKIAKIKIYEAPEKASSNKTDADKTKEPVVRESVIGNKNKLLKLLDGANGVKTGYTKKSGRCLIGGAKRDGMQLISVVLNYNDMWNDTARMLNTAFQTYDMCPVEKALLNPSGGAEITLKAGYDKKGNLSPKYYPVKSDGSERLTLVS
jgi:D-alanyl-D-alanine carboxypeptidase (penicillin-binding protein 5/6)